MSRHADRQDNRKHLQLGLSIILMTGLVTACGGEIDEQMELQEFENPVSFEAHGSELQERLVPSPDGIGYVLDGVLVEDPTFDRVAFMFDAGVEPIVEVRSSMDGGVSWSDWHEATVTWSEGLLHNAHADLPHGGTDVEVRLLDPEPRDVSLLHLEGFVYDPDPVDEQHEQDGLGTQGQALAANRALDVTRAGWNARSSRCSAGHTINRVTLHHTATPTNDSISPAARMRQMQNYHMDNRGWCDLGYHFVIGLDGKVYQGRVETLRGAHVGGNNTGNAGVSFMGNYTNSAPSGAMMHAGARTLSAIACHYGFSLNGSSVKGHRDYAPGNECPGTALYNRMPGLIQDAANMGCDGNSAPPAPPPSEPEPSPSPDPGPGTGSAHLQGIVYEHGDTSSRISGATVSIGSQRVTTNSNGYYSARVTAGSHTVSASASGFENGSVTRQVSSGGDTWASIGLRPQEQSAQTARLVGVVFERPSSSDRISGANVRLSNGDTTTTDPNGYFSFDVPAGSYTVTASRSGFQTSSVSRTVGGGETVWSSVGLRRHEAMGKLLGVVYEDPNTNRRISGATVTLCNGQSATSSSNGAFSFDVPAGTYRITADASGYGEATVVRTVGSGEERWGSVGLSAASSSETGELIGVIYVDPDTSERVPGARVWTSTGQSTHANSNGVYTLTGVPAGQVTVYAGATGYTSGSVQRGIQQDGQVWGSIGLTRSEGGGEPAPEVPLRLIAPVDNASASSDPEFEWENISEETAGSESFSYYVALVSEDGSETHEAAVAGEVGGETRSSIGLSLSSGRWLWAVYAIADSGDVIAASPLDSFVVN